MKRTFKVVETYIIELTQDQIDRRLSDFDKAEAKEVESDMIRQMLGEKIGDSAPDKQIIEEVRQ